MGNLGIVIEHMNKKYSFSDKNGNIVLYIKKNIRNPKFKNLYICNLEYCRDNDLLDDKQSIIYNDIVIQINLDMFEKNSYYYYFVFKVFLEFNRINNLHASTRLFDLNDKYGKYVGSVIDGIKLDYSIDNDVERFIYTLSYTKNMCEVYGNIFDNKIDYFGKLSPIDKKKCVKLFVNQFDSKNSIFRSK